MGEQVFNQRLSKESGLQSFIEYTLVGLFDLPTETSSRTAQTKWTNFILFQVQKFDRILRRDLCSTKLIHYLIENCGVKRLFIKMLEWLFEQGGFAEHIALT